MADSFRTAGLTLLLQQKWLVPEERRILEIMLGAETVGNFNDEVSRMWAREPHLAIILQNIKIKAQNQGLDVALKFVKAHYDQQPEVQGDVHVNPADAPERPDLYERLNGDHRA